MSEQQQVQKKKKGVALFLEIFQDCIGEQNGIAIKDLFHRIYGYPEMMSDYEVFFKMQMIQRMFNYMRRKTNAFIVLKNGVYFVVTTRSEAQEYMNRLKQTKRQIDDMMNRCNKAIDDQLWRKLQKL